MRHSTRAARKRTKNNKKGLRWIEENSFEDCPALSEICYGGTEENWKKARTGYNHTPFLPVPVVYGQTAKTK